jgi:hypothetical protein
VQIIYHLGGDRGFVLSLEDLSMRRAFRIRFPVITLSVLSLVVSVGCLDFGSDTGDDGGGGSSTPQGIVDDIATGVVSVSVEATVGMLQGVIEWTSPGFGSGREESVVWNDVEQAWIITASEAYEDEEVSGQLDVSYWVQFLSEGTPQQNADDFTDEVAIVATAENFGNYHPGSYEVDFAWVAEANLNATRNEDESVDYVGNGMLDGITTTHYQDATFTDEQQASWTYDLAAAPDQACVSGTMVGTAGDYSFTATFNGAGGVVWTVERGSTEVDSSDQTYDCDPEV